MERKFAPNKCGTSPDQTSARTVGVGLRDCEHSLHPGEFRDHAHHSTDLTQTTPRRAVVWVNVTNSRPVQAAAWSELARSPCQEHSAWDRTSPHEPGATTHEPRRADALLTNRFFNSIFSSRLLAGKSIAHTDGLIEARALNSCWHARERNIHARGSYATCLMPHARRVFRTQCTAGPRRI